MRYQHIFAQQHKSMKSTIGQRLKDIRLDARLTQKEMAEMVGLTPGSIGAMENDLYTPNYEVLRAIHTKLGVSYDYIIDGLKTTENASKLASENKELKAELDRMRKVIDKLLK